MHQVKLNDATGAAISGLKERAAFVDEEGRVIGYFEPTDTSADLLKLKAFREYDPEKARRASESPGDGLTTDQLMAYLRSLDGR